MNRKEFLTWLGTGSAGAAVAMCMGACAKSVGASTEAPANVDFTLDLRESGNAALLANGGYLYKNGVLVARTITGSFIAVQQVCTHETVSITYQGNRNRFYCDGHGATFSESGSVTGGPAPGPLKTYSTSLTGNSLRVYS